MSAPQQKTDPFKSVDQFLLFIKMMYPFWGDNVRQFVQGYSHLWFLGKNFLLKSVKMLVRHKMTFIMPSQRSESDIASFIASKFKLGCSRIVKKDQSKESSSKSTRNNTILFI